MDELMQVRSLEVIEAEINFYKNQTAVGIIEIGKRLIEAKKQLKHGEWINWLNEKVEFSLATAENFMRIAIEYSDSSLPGQISYSKLLLLMTVPPDQRDEFMKMNNVNKMTTRQIEVSIKDWKTKLHNTQKELNKSRIVIRKLENESSLQEDKIQYLRKENARLEAVKDNYAKQVSSLTIHPCAAFQTELFDLDTAFDISFRKIRLLIEKMTQKEFNEVSQSFVDKLTSRIAEIESWKVYANKIK
jgi:hypothetical protein